MYIIVYNFIGSKELLCNDSSTKTGVGSGSRPEVLLTYAKICQDMPRYAKCPNCFSESREFTALAVLCDRLDRTPQGDRVPSKQFVYCKDL